MLDKETLKIVDLKSNMDRFIGIGKSFKTKHQKHLKSNMDRFIVSTAISSIQSDVNLKSNMDRFIGFDILKITNLLKI